MCCDHIKMLISCCSAVKTLGELVENGLFYFLDKHIDFWTRVEDGNLSQTSFIIIFWKYKYKIILSTSGMWETPIHLLFFSCFFEFFLFLFFFYNRAWASHTRRPERSFQTVSPFSQLSCLKSLLTLKNGQVVGMGKTISNLQMKGKRLLLHDETVMTAPLWNTCNIQLSVEITVPCQDTGLSPAWSCVCTIGHT